MRHLVFFFFFTWLFCQEKYPVDTIIKSKKTSLFNKIFLLPIAGWQRVSYNSNFFNCQYFPSCSNYGAKAIGEYGIIRGSIIASERITRCNPFALHYHLELNRPFHDSDGRLIDPINQNKFSNSTRSPLVSAILSAIIPGTGRMYAGRTMDGIMGFWSFYLTSSLAYNLFSDNRYSLGSLFGTIAAFTYLGEIYGAWRSAKYYQKLEE